MRFRGLIAIALLATAGTGCGDGTFFVRGELFRPAPAIPALEESKGEDAYNLVYIAESPSEVPDGTVSVELNGGTTLSGNIDRVAGTFDWTYKYVPSSALATLREYGSLTFGASGLQSATFYGHAIYRDGTEKMYDLQLTVDGNFVVLEGHDEQNAQIESVTTVAFDRIDVLDIWDLANTYRLEVSTTYFLTRSTNVFIRQEIVRDDRTTPGASPDREANFEVYWDLSGVGLETINYGEGVTAVYDTDFFTDGSATEQLTFEDPSTEVSPDAEGLFDYEPDASGDGTYREYYDDGSLWDADYLFRSTYFDDVYWTYDMAESPVGVDLDGEIYYVPDQSGTGVYRRYDTGGPVEICDYAFDTEDNITDLSCSQPRWAVLPTRLLPDATGRPAGPDSVQTP